MKYGASLYLRYAISLDRISSVLRAWFCEEDGGPFLTFGMVKLFNLTSVAMIEMTIQDTENSSEHKRCHFIIQIVLENKWH